MTLNRRGNRYRYLVWLVTWVGLCFAAGCAPRVVHIEPTEGAPGTKVSLAMEYLVGWPRVQIGNATMDWDELTLSAKDPARKEVPGEELVWIEDKVLEFTIPDLLPGNYTITVHDDKGPPGALVYSFLETTAYVIFPPVWPFVFRSNQTQLPFKILPRN